MYKLLPILLFAYGLALTTDDIYDNSYALIIGIDNYNHVSNLDYAVKDANSIATLLRDNFNFPSNNIKTLLNNMIIKKEYHSLAQAFSEAMIKRYEETRKCSQNFRLLVPALTPSFGQQLQARLLCHP